MVLKQIFSWWYGPGWVNSFKVIFTRVELLSDEFSLAILAKTLFEPWKQIKSYIGPNTPIEVRFRVIFDNIFARLVGFIIRSFVILIGLIFLALTALFGFVLAIIWPLIPLLPVALIITAIFAI